MPVSRNRNGSWRAQVYDATTKKRIAVREILADEPENYPNEAAARKALKRASDALEDKRAGRVPVRQYVAEWIANPPKGVRDSTVLTYESQVQHFLKLHGDKLVSQITPKLARTYFIQQGGTPGHLAGLRVLFNRAVLLELIPANPFKDLNVFERSRASRKVEVAASDEVELMLALAREHTPPAYHAWLLMGAFAGARPGEIDAMKWKHLDLSNGGGIYEIQQKDGNYNPKTGRFGPPKNGRGRPISLCSRIVDALVTLPRESEFIFTTERGTHWTPSSRNAYWKVARAGVAKILVDGKEKPRTLYACTRHHYGWWAINVLQQPIHVVADQLGHTDGGVLVGKTYGHPDRYVSIERLRQAANAAGGGYTEGLAEAA